MDLTIKKDRVLKAAEKCSTAKGVLTELFPELFEVDINVQYGSVYKWDEGLFVVVRVDEIGYALVNIDNVLHYGGQKVFFGIGVFKAHIKELINVFGIKYLGHRDDVLDIKVKDVS